MPSPGVTQYLYYVRCGVTGRWLASLPGRGVSWEESPATLWVVRFWSPQDAARWARVRGVKNAVTDRHAVNYYHKDIYPKGDT